MKQEFLDYFEKLIGPAERDAFVAAIEAKATYRGLRANALRTDTETLKAWLERRGYSVSVSPYSSDGLILSGSGSPLSLKLPYQAGHSYPQDLASMFAVELLDPKPGEWCIDLTAAPGGKSTHMAQRMNNEGVLISNDMDTKRLKSLKFNLQRLGIVNTMVFRATPYKISEMYPERFDRVLLDPSCSGEGLYVTREGQPELWSEKSISRYTKDQFSLLCSAFRLLRPGGRLVYSTCTLNAEEDHEIVEQLLQRFPNAELDPFLPAGVPPQPGDLPGIRFWPQHTKTKGFFCMAITKTHSSLDLGEDFSRALPDKNDLRSLKGNVLREYLSPLEKRFGELPSELWQAPFVLHEDHLYLVSRDLLQFPLPPRFDLSFPFLKVQKKRSSLTHAGALMLGAMASEHVLELNSELAEAYFDGTPGHHLELEDGQYLLRHEGFALGQAKIKKGRLEWVQSRQY